MKNDGTLRSFAPSIVMIALGAATGLLLTLGRVAGPGGTSGCWHSSACRHPSFIPHPSRGRRPNHSETIWRRRESG